MIDRDTRAAIHTLSKQGYGKKKVARLVGVSKHTVQKVLASGVVEVPEVERSSVLDKHLELTRQLYASCEGNRARVHEELCTREIEVGYPTLTAFMRRHAIGVKPKRRAGQYHFEPGQEMQHDTSPHDVKIAGRIRRLQCASLVLCYSRRQYAQVYPRWSRFEARVFLTEALQRIGGAAKQCMLDNSSVIMIGGTGKYARPAPEMKALQDRFDFDFVAHALGDANRSARVERPFHYVENNFYKGRVFSSLADLNEQLLQWCHKSFHKYRKRLGASPAELFVVEKPALKALPEYVSEVYELHRRRVDVEGYVSLHTNRYSVDAQLIHRHVEIRETVRKVRIFDGHQLAAEHAKEAYGARKRSLLDVHRGQTGRANSVGRPTPQEILLCSQGPDFEALIQALRKRHGGRAVKAVRRLHRLWNDHPTEPVREAISVALKYGLTDLQRIERMVLRRIAGDFFRLPIDDNEPEDDDDG